MNIYDDTRIVKPTLAARGNRAYARRMRRILLGLSLALAVGCASTEKKEGTTPAGAAADQPGKGSLDTSRCDSSGKKVTTVDLNSDGKPDVWKFYATEVENGARVDVLTCKEVDLNMDGKKDAWIYYDNAGNVANEEYDLDFDGRIDLWVYRQNGKKVREEFDSNFDGKPDIWKFYEGDEKLTRLERSSKRNGKVDVWEYYEGGKLERIGYDTTGSGQIDRWDRAPDEQASAAAPGAAATPGAPTANKAAPETVPQPKAAPPTVSPETAAPAKK